MQVRRWVASGLALSLLSNPLFAAGPTSVQDVLAEVQQDSVLVSGWTHDQLKFAVPFNGTSGDVVPKQLDIFGIEAGVEGVASSTKVDVNGLHTLPTSLVNTQDIDTLSRLPIPAVIAHAKFGLPIFGLDAGLRGGGIPKETINSGSTHSSIQNTIFGIDLRKKLIEEGVAKPFGLTLGLNYTHIKGSFDANTPLTINSQTFSGHTATFSNAQGTENSNWNMNSYGVQAIMNKQILFMNPYIGASANYNAGSLDTSILTTGDVSVDGGAAQDISTVNGGPVQGGVSGGPNKWDARALLGIEFSFLPFCKLGLGGEYGGSKNSAANVGLRFQFR